MKIIDVLVTVRPATDVQSIHESLISTPEGEKHICQSEGEAWSSAPQGGGGWPPVTLMVQLRSVRMIAAVDASGMINGCSNPSSYS